MREFLDLVQDAGEGLLRRGLDGLAEERFRQGGGKAWKEVYSAGHGVAFIREIPSAKEVVARLVEEYRAAKAGLP